MYLFNHSLLVILVVGVVAGGLAGVLITRSGFGRSLPPRLGIGLGTSIVPEIVDAAIGALALLYAGRRPAAGGWR